MAKSKTFEDFTFLYETWYEKHSAVYESELQAIKELLPANGRGVEIGLGTGNFAADLGLEGGIEPAPRMRERAISKGLDVKDGIAENLPYKSNSFNKVLIVTVCFLDDVPKAIAECHRILVPGGKLVVGIIDKEGTIGKYYQTRKDNVFYRNAIFYTAQQMQKLFESTGFSQIETRQTLFKALHNIDQVEKSKPGFGEGSFVVIKGEK